jgi:hypothetical protein
MTHDLDPTQPPLINEDRHPVFDTWDSAENIESLHCAQDVDDEPQHPINWNLLTSDEAEAEWLDLNAWVFWLRATYGLPPTVVPPFWHRHDELVSELSALHQHWLNSYDPEGSPSAPLAWHRDCADARTRLREWVSTSGTRLDRDSPTRQTAWPGEAPIQPAAETVIANRDADFVQFVLDDVIARRRIEERVRARASEGVHRRSAHRSRPQALPSPAAAPSRPSHGEHGRPSGGRPQEGSIHVARTRSHSRPGPAPTSRPWQT